MDWVHCNACYYRPGQQPKKELIMTTCGHIFCKCCERSSHVERCKVCGQSGNTTPLTSQMIEEVRVYFEEPDAALSQVLKVMDFQKSHRMRLNEYLKTLWEKYQKLKYAYQKLDEENRKIKKELEMIRRRMSVPHVPSPPFSQESPFLQMLGNKNRTPMSSPLFAIPTRPASSSHNYRNHNTPSTPMTGDSSPDSVASQQSYCSAASGRSASQQRMYRPGLTPPVNRLNLLSVSTERARESSSRY